MSLFDLEDLVRGFVNVVGFFFFFFNKVALVDLGLCWWWLSVLLRQ